VTTDLSKKEGKMEENNSLAKESENNMTPIGKPPRPSLKLNINSLG